MRSHLSASLFVVSFVWSFSNSITSCAQGDCLDDQRALLIQMNQSLISRTFPSTRTSKRISWRLNTDCCSSWDGIACDRGGHVVGLDLSSQVLHGELNKSNSLFKLRYLVRLNLANNRFDDAPFPSGFDQLTNLEYLNLSNSGFAGQIPIGISRMTRLVTLDLSSTNPTICKLVDPDLETLTRNLTELRELFLDGVDLSRENNKWCRALSSSLHKLRVLSLSGCGDLGNFDSSLSKLRSLSVLRLDISNISGEVPKFFSKFHNLTSLHLNGCYLYGKFPESVLQLQTLQSLELSGNDGLQGSLPEFPKGGLLRELVLSETSFKGELPNSIGNLRFLSRLDLRKCRFNGSIPSSFSKLNQNI